MANQIFPDGMQEALAALLASLGASKNSYSISVFRYAGRDSYTSEIRVTDLVETYTVDDLEDEDPQLAADLPDGFRGMR